MKQPRAYSGDRLIIGLAVYDVPSARLVEIVGFPSLFLGSSKSGEAYGLPDWGLRPLHEQVEFFGHIAQNVGIPALADIDVNSDTLDVYRAVKQFAQADVAALYFGDQILQVVISSSMRNTRMPSLC